MPTVIIDDKEITVTDGTTIMEAARQLGIDIPHFCYHPKLCVAGNCRICLVEVEKSPKPVASCAWPVNDGMVVHTQSDMAKSARKGVMELLLINHPLDCPVCDQGGECTLQDLAMKHGPDRSRFCEEKRQSKDRDLGPLIESVMNRCIQCTRCIRFSQEIAGVEEMGATYRGDHMSVGTWVQLTISSELSGNMVEICPVGALNAKPFHFKARGWELKNAKGVCGHCPVGCHIYRDHQNGVVERVRTRNCDPINETWICDKGRFAYDGLSQDRLTTPQSRHDRGLSPTQWRNALEQAADLIKEVKPAEVAGLADAGQAGEDLYAFQDFLRQSVGTAHMDHRLRQRDFSGDEAPLTRADLLMNTPLADLGQADAIVLVGCDPRYEVPMLNLRLRKAGEAKVPVFAVNPVRIDSTIPGLEEVTPRPGEEGSFLGEILSHLKGEGVGTPASESIAKVLKGAERPAIILGSWAAVHPHAEDLRRLVVAILAACKGFGAEWNGFNRLMPGANAVAAQDLGMVPHRGPGYTKVERVGLSTQGILEAAAAGEIKVLFLLGADPLADAVDRTLARAALKRAKVIAITTHLTEMVKEYADVVLPGVTLAEKNATLTNCEGRAQRSAGAVPPQGESKEDWRILRALSDRFATPLPYNTIEALRARMAQADHRYNLDDAHGELPAACDHSPVTLNLPAESGLRSPSGTILVGAIAFYRDDLIARRSKIMAALTKEATVRINPAEAAEKGLADGNKVRLIHGERTLETTVTLDGRVPKGVLLGRYGAGAGSVQELTTWESGYPVVSLVKL